MAEKKSWRDYLDSVTDNESSGNEKTGTWRDYLSGVTTERNQPTGGWRDQLSSAATGIVANEVTSRVNSWLQKHNSYISDYQKRYSSRKGNYEDAYVSDSADWLTKVNEQKSKYDTEADEILSYLDQNKDYLDADWVKSIKDTISKARGTQSKIIDSAKSDNEFWSSFGNEELVEEYGSAEKAYKANQLFNANAGKTTTELDEILANMEDGEEKEWLTSYRSSVDYDEKSKLDTQTVQKEIDELETVLKEAQSVAMNYGHIRDIVGPDADADLQTQIRELIGGYSNGEYYTIKDLETAIAEKRQTLVQAKRIQDGIKMASVADPTSELYDPEFSKYTGYTDDGKKAIIPDYKDVVYDVINKNADSGDYSVGQAWGSMSDTEIDRLDVVKYMTTDEVALYNYYYNKHGYEAAEKYLDGIVENLNALHGQEIFKPMENKPFLELVFGISAGFDQFNSGIKNIFSNEDYIPTSATQYASGLVREDMKDVDLKWYNFKEGEWDDAKIFGNSLGQTAYDLTTTAANMAPSILVSTLVGSINPAAGAVVGNTLMGTSAAGNAYADAINRGFGKAEARTYGVAIGASEALLQQALGGIGKLGGSSAKITKAVAGIDNALLRFSLQYGGKIASEALEEGLQEILDPIFQNAILHADEDVDWSAVAYSALLGGLSAGTLELGGTIKQTRVEQALKKNYNGNTDSLIQEGLESDITSDSYKLATEYKAKTDSGKTLTGAEIRQLLEANQEQITPKDLKKIQQAAEKRLTALGQTENVAKIAELATKRATGQNLTRAEKSLLANSKYGARVANELLPSNIKSGDYTTGWAEGIGTRKVNKDEYNITQKKIASILEEMAKAEDPATYKSLEERVGNEDKLSVSESGQATIRATGETIDLGKVEVVDFVRDKESGKITDMTLNAGGKEVKASEIDYADGNQSYLFSAVSKIENINPGDATTILRGYKADSGLTVGEYLNGVDEAYTYGYHGYSEADMGAGLFTPKLSKEQAKGVYLMGRATRESSDTNKSEAIKRMRTAVEAEAEKAAAEGKEAPKAKKMTITYKDKSGKVASIDKAGITDAKQSGGVKVAKILHRLGLGTNFEFFTSYLSETIKDKKGNPARVYINENGVETAAPAGVYRMSDGTIRIDLEAYNGRKLTLNALAHELTHFIQQWSDAKYKVLVDFLMKSYEKTDMTMHERVLREQTRLEEIRGEAVSYNEAYDEVVANAMMKMFDDGKLVERLTELKATDEKLARKLWQGFKKILSKFLGVYQNESALFHDTDDLMQMKDTFEQLQNLFAEALVEASDNFQASITTSESQTLTEAGIGFDENTKSVYSLNFSTAYKDEIQVGKKTFDAEAIAQLVSKVTGRSIEDARKWVQSEMTIANIVMQNPEFLDFEADNRYEAIKKNSDYPQGTVDLSNLCPKREEFTAMFDMLQKKYPNKLFTAQDVADMRKILSDNDITVACGACFVEDRRQLLGEIADTYINMWKEAVETGKPLQKTNAAGNKVELLVTKALAKQYGLTAGTKIMATDTYIPNQYDLTTYEGFKKLEKNHPTIAMGFNRYNNSRGQQSARLIEGRAEYNRQILGWSDAKVRSVNNNGGLRIFSFSDFEVVHLLDLVQVIIDCAAKGVKIQGYTKIPAFAKLVRGTGIKLNRSLIPKGDYGFHIENGKVVLDYDTTEGIDINDKNFIDESNNPNVGNIVIGINPTQIGAAMLDPFIDYIIPFHSNKAKEILRKLGTGEWVNYKESQHEKDISTGKASKHNVNIYTEVINKYHPTNKVEFVEAFLKECKRQGKIPRYAEFLNVDANGDYAYREGYHKLLVDFKMFDADGNILPQGNITPNLDESFMKELLNAEIDKKQSYEFPQKVYDAIDKKFGEQYSSQETDVDKPKRKKKTPLLTKGEVSAIQSIGRKNITKFDSSDFQKTEKLARIYWAEMKTNSPFFRAWFGEWRATDETPVVTATKQGVTRGLKHNNDTGWDINVSGKVFDENNVHTSVANREATPYLAYLDDIIENAVLLDTSGADPKSPDTLLMHSLYAVADIGNGPEVLRLYVEEMNSYGKENTDKRAYNLQNIEKAFATRKRVQGGTFSPSANVPNAIVNVADLIAAVKVYDANYKPKPVSEVVDKGGKPLPMFHATRAVFTEFDRSKIGSSGAGRYLGYGFNFASSEMGASSYGNNMMSEFLRITSPLSNIKKSLTMGHINRLIQSIDSAIPEFADDISQSLAWEFSSTGYNISPRDSKATQMAKYQTAVREAAKAIFDYAESDADIYSQISIACAYPDAVIDTFSKIKRDGVLWYSDDGSIHYAVIFNSQQAKSTTDNIGTFDGNNPDTLFSSQDTDLDRDANTMSDRAKEILANAKPKMIGKIEKADIEFDTVRELFNELNADKDIQDLAERVFKVAKDDHYGYYGYGSYGEPKSHLRLPMAFVGKNGIPDGVHGQFRKNTIWGDIVFSYEYFMDESVAPQSKASTILHEVIHAITCSHIESAYRWIQAKHGMYADPLAITDFDGVDERIKSGIELIDAFEQVRSAPTKDGKNLYGQLTAYEMIAEMANVEFRSFLKKQNLWGRIVDAIKRIFGIEPRNAYDAVSNALEKILMETTNDADAQRAKIVARKENIRNSTQETDYISNRELLANAFEGLSQNSEEYKLIQDYKGRIKILNEYEEKLSELNAEIRKITFGTEGERDSKKLKELQEEAKKVAENINRNDKKLLSLEASEPLRKVIERERKKEAQKTKTHVKQLLKNKKDRAEQTELRHKIRKSIRDLDKLLNRGNKKLNVKEDMKGFVSKALDLADYLFTDHISNDELIRRGITVPMRGNEPQLVKETEEILTKLYDEADSLTDEEFTRLDAKRKANEEKLRDLLTAQRNDRLSTPVYQLFDDLVTEYASLKNSKQEAVRAAYNEELEKSLRAFMSDDDRVKILKNMRVADMTTEELNWLYRAYTMVLTNVRDANKFHVNGMNESIEQVVGQIAADFGSRKIPDKKLAIAAQKLANKFGWSYEKLYYALDRIGSDAFTKLIMNLADSENIVMQDIIEAMAFRDEIVKNHGFNNWAVNKEIDREFLDNTGKKFKLTLGQMMSLYAYSRREGAWDHIEYGGFVFGETALTNPKPADSYKLSKEQCEAITSLLTKEQKAYVEDMQKYLSETMGSKGNEVSMKLYGIKMFNEEIYFPIHIAGQFKAQAQESQAKAAAGFSSMSNAGFTHAQNPNAKAPFVLEGFNEVWSDHVNEMSRYHGTVPALEDIRRVMNRSTYSDSVAESQSIKQLMENHYGKEAVEYFDNLYREANSGAITDKLQNKAKKLLSLFRKNSVAYSLSVIIQQPTALVRAYAMIDKKYFGFKGFGTITSGIAKAVSSKWNPAYANAYNEMLKYAPGVTMAKEIGGFDTATGGSIRSTLLDTGKNIKQKWNTGTAKEKGNAVLDLVDNNAVANLPSVADKIAWIEIWNACKRETVATHKNLEPGSEAFMQAVGERFTEVIRATQVYDSIFSKSPMLKSKNLGVQMLVSFMNEPNTVANMVEKAVRDTTKGNWKGGLRTGAAVIYSIIFNNVLKSLVYALRDDDEDETYIEKYIEAITGGMMDDFWALNYIPLVRDAWSLSQGFDVERADMAIVADALGALGKVIQNGLTDTDNMTEDDLVEFDKKVTDANWKLVESLAAFFGIPVKNIRREIMGVIDHARIASANAGMTTELSLWDKVTDSVMDWIPFVGGGKSKQDKLFDAIINGDKSYMDRLKATYKTEDAYHSAVRKALRENDSRIKEAAQARYDGNTDEYKRIFREIQNEGNFSFDDIMSAINTELSKLTPDKVTSDYTASGYVEAIAMGNTTEAEAMKEDIIATKVANGKTQEEAEKEFSSSVATGIKNAYYSGLLDKAGAEKMLMEYADMDEEEAASKVSYWSFVEEHQEYKDVFTENRVAKYLEFAEPADIPVDVYVQFIYGTKGLKTIKDEWGDVEVTEREQILDVIDSLPLTWQQKDALYLAAELPESKIWDVPW